MQSIRLENSLCLAEFAQNLSDTSTPAENIFIKYILVQEESQLKVLSLNLLTIKFEEKIPAILWNHSKQ